MTTDPQAIHLAAEILGRLNTQAEGGLVRAAALFFAAGRLPGTESRVAASKRLRRTAAAAARENRTAVQRHAGEAEA